MENKKLQEMVMEAREKLIRENILEASVANVPVQATSAYETSTDDWKYLTLAYFL
jgi:hypothetical protein